MRDAPYPLAAHMGIIAARVNLYEYDRHHALSLSPDDAQKIIEGIQIYQQHPHRRKQPDNAVTWERNGVTMAKPKGVNEGSNKGGWQQNPLLIIPSLINQSYILDLSPEKSMLRYLNGAGIPTYLMDWGTLTNMQSGASIQDVVQHINDAVEHLSAEHNKTVDILGYCMGGTLSILSTLSDSRKINKIVLLATPWDFKAENSTLAQHIKIWSNHVMPTLQTKQSLPSEWIQSLFASLDKKGAAKKFIKFANMDQNSDKAKLFVMVEDWLNDGIDLPAQIAHECIENWFSKNQLSESTYHLNGAPIGKRKIDNDCLVVASKQDKIVSYESAIKVHEIIDPNCREILSPDVGHVGLIVGNKARDQVWNPIIEWLKK